MKHQKIITMNQRNHINLIIKLNQCIEFINAFIFNFKHHLVYSVTKMMQMCVMINYFNFATNCKNSIIL